MGKLITLVGLIAVTTLATLAGTGRKFYDDDPLWTEPETQDASAVESWDIDLAFDLAYNMFARPGASETRVRAQNINTVDEVPDSSWFTNRIGFRPLSVEELVQGPATLVAYPGVGIITRPKDVGDAPGFIGSDENGDTWFVSFDARGHPEAATGSLLVASKLFWALGYWQAEQYVYRLRPDELEIAPEAEVRMPSGQYRPMVQSDLQDVLARAEPSADGSYRVAAALAIPGRVLGGFRYHGTRPDDPNDVVPHEHRRELRALKVFGAWTNLVDMKAGNTLDTLIDENGQARVRHYLQDVGSTFGSGANGPREWDEGSEYLFEAPSLWRRLVSFGFYLKPWQTMPYEEYPAVGRFEGDQFDPESWRPRTPNGAYLNAGDDDTFWAARRVMAFTDEMLREVVRVAEFSDPAAEQHLADVLIARRDRIGAAYLLPKVNPLVDFELSRDGVLGFGNAAVDAGVAEVPGGYLAAWSEFDNDSGEQRAIGETRTADLRMPGPSDLPVREGSFVKIEVSAVDPPREAWTLPIHVYFKRTAQGWTLVGLERVPE